MHSSSLPPMTCSNSLPASLHPTPSHSNRPSTFPCSQAHHVSVYGRNLKGCSLSCSHSLSLGLAKQCLPLTSRRANGRRYHLNCRAVAAPVETKAPFLEVEGVGFQPPGSPNWLLKDVSISLPRNSLGLVFGRSGSGKTTLLHVLSGLCSPTCGTISLASQPLAPGSAPLRQLLGRKELAEKAGIVFQFPERYFLADNLLEELSFGWPRRMEDMPLRLMLANRVTSALAAVGLAGVPLDTNPRALSGGNQRRLALAIQLVRFPDLVLLDEPLAGLDWKAREDVVSLLTDLKRQRTVLVVSHDLRELAPLVDKSWCMHLGGRLLEEPLPADLEVDEEAE